MEEVKVEVTRYLKADGYVTRHWAVMVDGELLAVTLYRKGAEAVAAALTASRAAPPVRTFDTGADGATSCQPKCSS